MTSGSVKVRLRRRLVLALGVLCAALFACVARADAFVYWTNHAQNTIGRGALNGSWADQRFINGAGRPYAISVNDTHLFWTSRTAGTISRAGIDGSGVDRDFISTPGRPLGLAIDDTYVYWTQSREPGIWRARLDGTGAPSLLVDYTIDIVNLAVDATHIYWTSPISTSHPTATGWVARANLDGSGVEHMFIPAAGQLLTDVAVDAAHIYWLNSIGGRTAVGRASPGGTGIDQALVGGPGQSLALAVDGSHVYWSHGYRTIARARLDGTARQVRLIEDAHTPFGLAVDSLRGPLLRLGGVRRNARRGTAAIRALVRGRGRIALFGRGLHRATHRATDPGAVALPVRPTRRLGRVLRRRGAVGVTVRVRFALAEGSVQTRSRRLRLVLRR